MLHIEVVLLFVRVALHQFVDLLALLAPCSLLSVLLAVAAIATAVFPATALRGVLGAGFLSLQLVPGLLLGGSLQVSQLFLLFLSGLLPDIEIDRIINVISRSIELNFRYDFQ